jgi:O-antigen/teichoic acid export membrane protein
MNNKYFIAYSTTIINLVINILFLPILLNILNPIELGLWYLFSSVAALISILDLGFSNSVFRNLVYAWNGARILKKNGPPLMNKNKNPNKVLILKIIDVSKRFYFLVSLIGLVFLLLVGSPYIYNVIKFYEESQSYLMSWFIFSLGAILNLYYSYWNPSLRALGGINIAYIIQSLSKLFTLFFSFIGLLLGYGIFWLSLVYLINGVVIRLLSKHYFLKLSKVNLNSILIKNESFKKDVNSLFFVLFPNSIKIGIVYLSGWIINRSIIFVSSSLIGLEITGTLGFTMNILALITSFSGIIYNVLSPEIASLKVKRKTEYLRLFSKSVILQFFIILISILSLSVLPLILKIIFGYNLILLTGFEFIIISLFSLFEANHSIFANFILLDNEVPFTKPSIYTSLIIVLLFYPFYIVFNRSLIGLLLVPFLVQLTFSNWYWPNFVLKHEKVSIFLFLKIGLNDILSDFKIILKKISLVK